MHEVKADSSGLPVKHQLTGVSPPRLHSFPVQQLYCQSLALPFFYSNQKIPTSSLKFLLVRPYYHGTEGRWAWHWHSPSFEDVHRPRGTGSHGGRSCKRACFQCVHSGMMQTQAETIGGSTSSPETNQAWQSLGLILAASLCVCVAELWGVYVFNIQAGHFNRSQSPQQPRSVTNTTTCTLFYQSAVCIDQSNHFVSSSSPLSQGGSVASKSEPRLSQLTRVRFAAHVSPIKDTCVRITASIYIIPAYYRNPGGWWSSELITPPTHTQIPFDPFISPMTPPPQSSNQTRPSSCLPSKYCCCDITHL